MQTIAIIAPCFNENQTVIRFIAMVEDAIRELNFNFKLIIVDDGSSDNTCELLKAYSGTAANTEVIVISLESNLGHQGAIYQGVLFARTLTPHRYIILDSDGEDDPQAIPDLVTHTGYDIVHVARGKRNESSGFKLSYLVYRMIFKLITNKKMNFGNYCMVNNRIANSIVNKSFIHLAAFLSKENATRTFLTYDRKRRIDGRSKMNLSSLVYHAFKSLIEYAESLLMIFLKLFVVIAFVLLLLLGNVVYQKFFTHTAIPGWFSTLSIGLMNLAVACIGFFVIGLLLLNISNNRRNVRTEIYKRVR